MPNLDMLIGEVQDTSLVEFFDHQCKDFEISYAAKSSSSAVTVSVSGANLTVAAKEKEDSVGVVVTGTDKNQKSAAHRFYVSVEQPNRAPIVVGSIPDISVIVNRNRELGDTLSGTFDDPDGDELVYSVQSADSSVARAVVTRDASRFTVYGIGVGETTVTITATDPEKLSASLDVGVTVTDG